MEEIKPPLIVLNFKTYIETIGNKAIKTAKIAEKVSIDNDICIIVAPQLVDLANVAKSVLIPVFAQHIDPVKPGKHTGHVTAESVRETGAIGTIIGHSERPMSVLEVRLALKRARRAGLKTLICGSSCELCELYSLFGPNMIALEPPELIGGRVSVSKAKPEEISRTVEAIRGLNSRVMVLCGAGIRESEDVERAMKLGVDGIMVASLLLRDNLERRLENFASIMLEEYKGSRLRWRLTLSEISRAFL